MFSLMTLAGLVLCRLVLVRIAHLVLPEESWALSERVLYTAVFYLGALLLFFSMLRRYKAGTIWTGSFVSPLERTSVHILYGPEFYNPPDCQLPWPMRPLTPL